MFGEAAAKVTKRALSVDSVAAAELVAVQMRDTFLATEAELDPAAALTARAWLVRIAVEPAAAERIAVTRWTRTPTFGLAAV